MKVWQAGTSITLTKEASTFETLIQILPILPYRLFSRYHFPDKRNNDITEFSALKEDFEC